LIYLLVCMKPLLCIPAFIYSYDCKLRDAWNYMRDFSLLNERLLVGWYFLNVVVPISFLMLRSAQSSSLLFSLLMIFVEVASSVSNLLLSVEIIGRINFRTNSVQSDARSTMRERIERTTGLDPKSRELGPSDGR
jgi:hypothetical protein